MIPRNLLQLHEDISPEHYDVGIRSNLFQRFWHYRRFKEVLKVANFGVEKMCDIGCHSGLFTEQVFKVIKPKEVYGLDISLNAIKKAQKRISIGHFIVGDAHKLPFKSDFFDLVFCLEMLEHVDYPQRVLQEIHRILKTGGQAILLVPTNSLLFEIIWFLWNLRHPVWKHVHVQKFTGHSLEKMSQDLQFKVVDTRTFNLGMLKIVKLEKQ